jgi:hypothetical protein
MAAGLPELRVEIDASTNPTAWTSPAAWTRIDQTNGWRGLRITRGQQDTYGPVEPGEMVLTLSNDNGFLDPSYAASPYAGLLTPGRQLRLVHVKADATTQVIFRGNVEAWPVTFTNTGKDVTSTLVVRDFLALLGTSRLPASVVEYELARGVRYPRASSVYPMNEETGFSGTVVADTISGWDGTPKGSPRRTNDLVPFVADEYGYELGAGRASIMTLPNGAFQYASPPWSIVAMTRVQDGGTMSIIKDDAPSVMAFECLPVGSETRIVASVTDSGGTKTLTGSHIIDDDVASPLMLTDDGSTLRAYLGQGTFTGSVTHGAVTAVSDLWVVGGVGKSSALGLLILWNGVRITPAQMTAVHDDIVFPWAADITDQRITKLLDIVAPGIVKSYLLGDIQEFCLPATLGNSPALPLIRRATEAADGRCWIDRTGTLRYAHRQTSAPGAALRTYGSAGTGGVPVRRVAVTDAHEDVVTHCLVVSESGTRVAFNDTAASKKRGEHRWEIKDSPLAISDAMWHLAERTVHYRKDPRPYVNELDLAPSHPDVGYDATLALDLYDRVDAAYVRPWDSAVVTSQGEVIGVEHVGRAIGGAEFTTRLRLRPPRSQRIRMNVPGTTGGATTPDSAANSITGDLDVRARFYRDDWTASGFHTVIAKDDYGTTGGRSWALAFNGNKIDWAWFKPDNTLGSVVTVRLPRASARPLWLRGTVVVATGVATLYSSDDGADWRILGTATGGLTGIRDSATEVMVGVRRNVGFTDPLNGRVLYAEVRNGIDGPVVNRFDPTAHAGSTAAASWVADTGETWTVQTGSQPLEAW